MWVYQKPESSEPLELLSAPSVPDSAPLKTNVTLPEPNEPLPAEVPSQAVPAIPEPMETPRKRSLRPLKKTGTGRHGSAPVPIYVPAVF